MDIPKPVLKVLIEMYRQRDCLWNVKSENYRKKNVKMRAYQDIVNFLKSNGIEEATDPLVRDRIQNMRRSVRKEKSKIERSKGTYKTNLWYYDMLDFTLDQNKSASSPNSNVKKVLKIEMEDSDTDCSSIQDPLYDANFPRYNQPAEQMNDSVTKYVRNPDEFEALGISIAAKVRRMESKQKIHAELLIQKVLAKGLLGQLNDHMELVDLSNS